VRLVDPVVLVELPTQLGDMPDDARAWAMSYDKAGRYLAVSFMHYEPEDSLPTSSSVAVWDLSEPHRRVTTIGLPADTDVPELVLSPDGNVLYVGSVGPNPYLKAIEVSTGKEITSADLVPWALAVSPDGSQLATSAGSEVRILDARNLSELHRLRGHTNDVLALRFSHDGSILASGSEDASTIVWDVESGQQLELLGGHEGPIRGLAFSPDDDTLHTGALDDALLSWDLAGKRRFVSLEAVAETGELPFLQLVSPSGDVIAYTFPGDFGGPASAATVRFLDVDSGELSPHLDVGHGQWGAAAWHPDGTRFATAGADGHIRIWDWRSRQLMAERRVAEDHIAGLDYTSDGNRIVVGERGGTLSMIDSDTLEEVGVPVELDAQVFWTFDGPETGTAIALTDGAEDVSLVDLEDGIVIDRSNVGAGWADASPSGDRVAVAGEEHLFDVSSDLWIEAATPHRGATFPVAYASDGSAFVTGGSDGRVLLWDGVNGELRSALPADYGTWPMPAFLPDSRTVILASHEPTSRVYHWDTDVAHWIEFACQVAGRNLTEEEWREAFGEDPYRETCP
jgi:WD40 repeat protein